MSAEAAASRVPQAESELIAAVDLGSNSFHMIVARLSGGDPQVVDRLRESVRLGAGLDEQGNLSNEAQLRALACLRRFGQRLQGVPRGSVRAVGTNTLRKAKNAREFIAAAELALGHSIEVVSGIEEARLIYLGVAHSLADDGARRLVIDIGGGSTEFIIGTHLEPQYLESLHMGCVSTTLAHFADGTLSAKRFAAAETAARLELEPIEARYRKLGWDVAIGASGTIRSVYGVLETIGAGGDGITLSALKQLRERVIRMGNIKRIDFDGLSGDRAVIFPGGLAVLIAAFEALRITRMRVASGALREGLLYDHIGRIQEHDVRDASVAALAGRYHVDMEHAARVRDTALECLEQVADAWLLGENHHAGLLRWAATLHEIGLDISHAQHHKHGAYIAENADLMGFSREVQKRLAALIRVHRRKFPQEAFQSIPKRWQEPLRRLAILLRLSVALHRSRSPEPLADFELDARDNALSMRFPRGWLEDHPLTRAELEQEAGYLKALGYKLDFV